MNTNTCATVHPWNTYNNHLVRYSNVTKFIDQIDFDVDIRVKKFHICNPPACFEKLHMINPMLDGILFENLFMQRFGYVPELCADDRMQMNFMIVFGQTGCFKLAAKGYPYLKFATHIKNAFFTAEFNVNDENYEKHINEYNEYCKLFADNLIEIENYLNKFEECIENDNLTFQQELYDPSVLYDVYSTKSKKDYYISLKGKYDMCSTHDLYDIKCYRELDEGFDITLRKWKKQLLLYRLLMKNERIIDNLHIINLYSGTIYQFYTHDDLEKNFFMQYTISLPNIIDANNLTTLNVDNDVEKDDLNDILEEFSQNL